MVMRPIVRRFLTRAHATAHGRKLVVAGDVSPARTVPAHIAKPPYAANGQMSTLKPFIPILDRPKQQRLRRVCEVAKEVLSFAQQLVVVGQRTDEIDRLVHEEIIRLGAYPSPLNYGGFPKSLCSSVNEIVVHGIPDRYHSEAFWLDSVADNSLTPSLYYGLSPTSRALEDGDIVNIDVSVFLDGFHGDTSQTFLVGNVDDAGKKLVQVTNDALLGAIETCCKPMSRFSSIGAFIQELCESQGFSVNEEYSGHGIGQEFHCLPFILHHKNNEPGQMLPGMAFTVEPAVCEGSAEVC
jgi:methionyl aminopeptidase